MATVAIDWLVESLSTGARAVKDGARRGGTARLCRARLADSTE